jgi:uncharacterized phiE125 gp8 family phage protein
MAVRWEAKRPNVVRDYRHDWNLFLDSDTIATSSITAEGVTLDSTTHDDTSVTVWLSGGTDGSTATITGTITTAGGRTETEVFTLRIMAGEPVSLADAKNYLGLYNAEFDAKICAMIPRARLWVEDHTGLALVRRQFGERRRTHAGKILLDMGPLVSVDSVEYLENGATLTYEPVAYPPLRVLQPAADTGWPSLAEYEAFDITYTAGFAEGDVDERLTGAMLALIEGEFSEGYAYPDRAIQAAKQCCTYLQAMVV